MAELGALTHLYNILYSEKSQLACEMILHIIFFWIFQGFIHLTAVMFVDLIVSELLGNHRGCISKLLPYCPTCLAHLNSIGWAT